jgi:glucokinase
MLLAGDVGGTKTQLGIFSRERGPRAPLAEAVFQNADYAGLETIIGEFLNQVKEPIALACFGAAGPVIDGRCLITNLPWVVDEMKLSATFHFSSVKVLNDLEAIAGAVPFLDPGDVKTLSLGWPVPQGNKAVVAPGTGLGEAFLTEDGARYRVHASEGGHADFAPNGPLQADLLLSLYEPSGHVSWDHLCSGRGIPKIYRFLKARGGMEPPWLSERLGQTGDPTPMIIAAALDRERPCGLCRETMTLFVSLLGAEAGNLALKVLARGGVYLAGGISLRILPILEEGPFMEAFLRKGRMSDLVAAMPVHVILKGDIALMGAACYGLEFLQPRRSFTRRKARRVTDPPRSGRCRG